MVIVVGVGIVSCLWWLQFWNEDDDDEVGVRIQGGGIVIGESIE